MSHAVFKEISLPQSLSLNSPVLQRKEGYREIYGSWTLFDLAAKLVWQGGEDVYQAGKRDVAVLYEYWLFFKLLEIVKQYFLIDPKSLANLIEPTANGLGLKLKSGKFIPLDGVYKNDIRNLQVRFSYNRTFGKSDYPEAGSWTKSMRPDYTLSLWPEELNEEDAEKLELMVHIHFDAKYRVEELTELLGKDDESALQVEKEEQRAGTYKIADLLKMHAYKDAIRRTAGAYVLYPGTDSETRCGFSEIIPGLGAFAIRPSSDNDGSDVLKGFIGKVVENLFNRASQHEHYTYNMYEVFKNKPTDADMVKVVLPESFVDGRDIPPVQKKVLIGLCKNEQHLNWILETGLYNFRATNRGSLSKEIEKPMLFNAHYLLIRVQGKMCSELIFRLKNSYPQYCTKSELLESGYPIEPSKNEYYVYAINKTADPLFAGMNFNLNQLGDKHTKIQLGLPVVVTLAELMQTLVNAES